MSSTEWWLPVEGFDYYMVSSEARVRSLDRKGHSGRILNPWLSSTGYLTVTLYQDGKVTKKKVHQLVATAFVGPRPPGQDVRHGPNGPLDNHPSQLCYGTQEQNCEDMVRDGTKPQGDTHHNAKLTVAIVAECRLRKAAGETLAALAAEFGVHEGTVRNAVTGITWPDCSVPPVRGHRTGSTHRDAKLTAETVRECRQRYANGERIQALAHEFGVSWPAMQAALNRKTWAHVL